MSKKCAIILSSYCALFLYKKLKMNNITLDDLIRKLEEYNKEEIDIVKKAYYYAYYLHKNQIRQSGEPYITHPLNVAYILKNKDRIRIVTDKLSYDPRKDWIDKAHTSLAKKKIREFSRRW